MKKIITIFILFIPVLSNAQLSKGTRVIGGNVGFSSETNDANSSDFNRKDFNFNISPKYGVFIKDNLVIGGALGYSYYQNKISGYQNYKYVSHYFNAGFFGKKFFPIIDKFLFSVNAELNYNRGRSELKSEVENKNKTHGLALAFRPSFVYFPKENWGFEVGVGSAYFNYTNNLSNDYETQNFGATLGGFNIGLNYYLK